MLDADASAQHLTLGDVAQVKPTFKDATSITRVNGRPAMTIEVSKRTGANLIEIGIPFSDPIADGPVVQAAFTAALAKGLTIADAAAEACVWGALTKAEMLLRQGLYADCRSQCEATLAAMPPT